MKPRDDLTKAQALEAIERMCITMQAILEETGLPQSVAFAATAVTMRSAVAKAKGRKLRLLDVTRTTLERTI